MTKIVVVSDTHNMLEQLQKHHPIPSGDILIHAGDHTGRGSYQETADALEELSDLKSQFKHILLIAGNHDWLAQRDPDAFRKLCTDHGLTYLMDEEVTIEGLRIYGSPWQPFFCNWAFNLLRGLPLREKWDLIPSFLDVLVTHGPPLGFGDLLSNIGSQPGKHIGDEELLKAIERTLPRAHVFGHIHEGYGTYQHGPIKLINGSSCDDRYRPVNAPIVFELDPLRTAGA